MNKVILLLTLMLLGCGSAIDKYDTLIDKNETCDQKWSDYEAQLQRRNDLIPNLVSVVKASAAHEEKVLKDVIEARASATQIKLSAEDMSDPDKVAAFEKAQSNVKTSLNKLMAIQEAYPDLKANQSFHDLQIQIEGTENRILRSREEYNKSVGDFNKELRRFSGKIINPLTGHEFKPRAYFKADSGSFAVPSVNFQ